MKRTNFSMISLLLFVVLLASFIGAISIIGPMWHYSSDGPYTNDTMYCNWTTSADITAQNITILKNSVVFSSTYENASLETLSNGTTVFASQTTKNDNWTCRIIAYNDTNNILQEVSVKIKNSAPTTEGSGAGIFYNGNDIGYVFSVTEDTSYLIDVNATDADNDALTYLQGDAFCTRISSILGTYNCTPTQLDLINNNLTLVNVTFIATDGQNPGGRTITFNITPVNDVPTLLLSNQTTSVNTSKNMIFSGADEENNTPLIYSIGAPAQIMSYLSVLLLNPQGTSFAVVYNASVVDYGNVGLWTITVNVTDNSTNYLGADDSKTGSYNFTLNITPIGRPPYFTNITTNKTVLPGIINLLQGETIQINFSGNDLDPNSTLLFIPLQSYFTIASINNNTNGGFDATGQVNYTPTNDHVGRFNVTVQIRDLEGLTNTTLLQFNVTNVNDPPVIYELSNNSQNRPDSNVNISDLDAYANTNFTYVVNATDPDIIYGDKIVFTDNTTIFNINSTTGVISFLPDNSVVSVVPYDILISATDNMSLSTSRLLRLTIHSNTPPWFNSTLPNLVCNGKSICAYPLGINVTDTETYVSAFNIQFIGSNILNFTYNTSTGLINFTAPKASIGNYTINVTIYDTFGAYNWSLMNITIVNVPEAPNLTNYNISNQSIVEMHTVIYELRATDDDFLVPSLNESVVFSTNLSGRSSGNNATIILLPVAGNVARALLTFPPAIGDAGSYTIEINATDSFGLVSRKILTFNILTKANAPNISEVTPWGNLPNNTINETYAFTSDAQFIDHVADVVFYENRSITFGVIASNLLANIDGYYWSVDGTSVGTNSSNFTKFFNYFTSGNHLVSINVTNDRYESSKFSWNLTIINVNQAPLFLHNLSNLDLNRSISITNYFYNYNNNVNDSGVRFIDPDDDTNMNELIDGSETNTLNFSTKNSCEYADITMSGANLNVDVKNTGFCYLTFNATDLGGVSLASNLVVMNITYVPSQVPLPLPTSGGGGGSSNPVVIPITKKYDTPKAFNLIAPKLVTIYNNNSIVIPIVINNTWNAPLKLLRLRAETNTTAVNTSFDINLFEDIPVNQSREVKVTVSNYRMGGNYELKIIANTTDPKYEDSALILLNSIESTSDGDMVQVKVTFANDLVNAHPECQELNEVLSQAKDKIKNGNIASGTELVDSVINGCKYLVSVQQNFKEKPSKLNPIITIDELTAKTIMIGLLIFTVLMSIVFVLFYHYTHKTEDDI